MPYERRWDPDVTESCEKTVPVIRLGRDGRQTSEMIACPRCGGSGERKVGGYVQVWVDPGPPTKK